MHFPLFVDISEKNILVVGGGTIASRRVNTLVNFVESITIVSPVMSQQIKELAQERAGITLIEREFLEEDLEGAHLVIAATDSHETNKKIHDLCKDRTIPINVSTDKNLCDFQFPSVVLDGDIVVGINASGCDHKEVKRVRRGIEKALDINKSLY